MQAALPSALDGGGGPFCETRLPAKRGLQETSGYQGEIQGRTKKGFEKVGAEPSWTAFWRGRTCTPRERRTLLVETLVHALSYELGLHISCLTPSEALVSNP
jgi:hypothetical protein